MLWLFSKCAILTPKSIFREMFLYGRGLSETPVPTPLDPHMNERPRTMDILSHATLIFPIF